ncbi:hypothetical protein [Catenulispora pinisilvae]|uniref:hypothetical protein n=1 Tax=Catenulispora pinisilvae TaxID=2705253 RepID=UPI001891ACFE|nr:hypothetical protein [Catenulispora pinisilvae]
MSSQPPWETQIQPGWGSQPQPPEQPRQPPQQPQQGGGWDQGSYTPPQPPQRAPQQPPPGPPQQPPPGPPGPPQHPVGGPYPQFTQQPPPPQFTPPQMPGLGPIGEEPPPKKNTGRILAVVAAVVVLAGAAGGIYMFTKGGKSSTADKSPSKPTAPATTPAAATTSATVPNNSYTSSAAPPASASAPGGGASLDNANTDKTPFTADALVAKSFIDDKKVNYELKFAQPMPCDKVGDAAVQTIVKSAPCTNLMAASWIDPANSRIVVSAMIIPYQDAATAAAVYKKLGTTHTGDYAQWCPPAGQPGADTCTKLAKAGNATREGKFGSFHRYVLITTAVYVDLRNDDTQKDWLTSAAHGAFQNTLPGQ